MTSSSAIALICLLLILPSLRAQSNLTIIRDGVGTRANATPATDDTANDNTTVAAATGVAAENNTAPAPVSNVTVVPANTTAAPVAAAAPANDTAPVAASNVTIVSDNTTAAPVAAPVAAVAPIIINQTAPAPAPALTPNLTLASLPYPPTNLTQYAIEAYFYSNDPNTQVISHHFCGTNNDTGIIQCALYDGRDPNTARLVGIEYVVNESLFNSFSPEEQRFWHSHAYGVQSGNVIVPEINGTAKTDVLNLLAGSYGKSIYLWTQALPIGDPVLLYSFTGNGQISQVAEDLYNNVTGTTAAQRQAQNVNATIPPIAEDADGWHNSGVAAVFNDTNVSLPANLWGLGFA